MDTIPNKSQCYFFYRRAHHRADFEYLQSVMETNLFFGDRNFVQKCPKLFETVCLYDLFLTRCRPVSFAFNNVFFFFSIF